MKLVMNIGLNTQKGQQHTKAQALEQVKIYFEPEQTFVKTGSWKGKPEQTLVVKTTIKGTNELNALNAIKTLCVTLEQDTIAVKIGDDATGSNGTIVYHPRYKGESIEFDNSLFTNL